MIELILCLVGVNYDSFTTQLWLFKNAVLQGNVYTDTLQNGDVAYFSVSPDVQNRVFEVYDNWRPPYGVLVAVEPSTGRVIALIGYNKKDPNHPWNKNLALKNTFPAASVFKVATALAAINSLGLRPEDTVLYRGRTHSSKPRIWLKSRYVHKCTFAQAFAHSNNSAFGLLADKMGSAKILQAAKRLGFVQIGPKDKVEKARLFNTDIPAGTVIKPKKRYNVMLWGAGFVNSTLSPLHGALIAAAVVNNGVMMKPSLIDSVVSKDGKVVWKPKRETLSVIAKGAELGVLKELFMSTVACGTAYRAFYDTGGHPVLQGVCAGGKTGTLTGRRPPEGRCEWFVGFGSHDAGDIGVASLVINRTKRKKRLKGSYPGEQAIEAFLGLSGGVPMCAVGKPVEKKKR